MDAPPDRFDDHDTRTVEEWRAASGAASRLGDYLQAVDLAARGLQQHPDSLILAYQRLLGFARAGATQTAEREIAKLERGGQLDAIGDARLRAHFAALFGRLLKDRAMAAVDLAERSLRAGQAAKAYERAYADGGGSYPAINAATLWRIAGDIERAAWLAREALTIAATEDDGYWRLATEAEAYLLLGEDQAAARALQAAVAEGAGRLDDIASTRRQLAWLARVGGTSDTVLDTLPVPQVLHWLADPAIVAPDIAALPLAPDTRTVAFGSLLSAADLALAEALHHFGAELRLVLPCAPALCRDFLVERAGADIGERFDRLLAVAESVSLVTQEGDPAEATVLHQALIQARGHALLRRASLHGAMHVLRLSNGAAQLRAPEPAAQDAAALVASWPDLSKRDPLWSGRTVRAMVFGDIHGFSGIAEAQHRAFLDVVIGGFADALAPLADQVEYAETAGDGLYVVLSDVVSAVRACHALHRAADPGRLVAAGLPAELGLRLSAHVGPVFHGLDRVTGREKFFGKEVIRTARIEPITPPGETYVTEQFAASLFCAAGAAFDCDYVGYQPMAKGFGACRMYSLRPHAASHE